MAFEAVHVDAVAVNGLADVVAGAMIKIFCVAGFFDDGAGGVVDLPALQRLAGGDAGEDEIDGGVAGGFDDAENFGEFFGDFSAEIADPGDVVVDAAGFGLLGEDVEEEEVAFANGRGGFARRAVMWIAGVGVYGDVWGVFGLQACGGEVR